MNDNVLYLIGIFAWLCLVALAMPGCSDQRPTRLEPQTLNAKTFWAERERWSGGDGSGP